MAPEWAILIIILICLSVFGLFRWIVYPSRAIDVYEDQRKNMSAGTHRAIGELDVRDINNLSIEGKVNRLNLLRRMGYVVLSRPPEGVELDENGIYRRKDGDPSQGS